MSKPIDHARKSVEQFGGEAKDYIDIHIFMDSSKDTFADVRHRVLTHNSWFISNVLPRVFGETRKNSADQEYSVRDIGEQHCLDDFNDLFVPTAQDFLQEVEMKEWMDNAREGALPPSRQKVGGNKRTPSLGPTSGIKEVMSNEPETSSVSSPTITASVDPLPPKNRLPFRPEREGGWSRKCVGEGVID